MSMPRARCVAAITIAICLAFVSAPGCRANRPRPGFVLRSERTTELNRGPDPSAGHGVFEEELVDTSEQPTPCRSSAGDCATEPVIVPRLGVRGGLLRRLAPRPARLPRAPRPIPAGAELPMHSRFHPVPTEPVFTRRNLPHGVGAPFGLMPSAMLDAYLPPRTLAPGAHYDAAPPRPLRQPQSALPFLENVALLPGDSRLR